jgi:hypothetical protein
MDYTNTGIAEFLPKHFMFANCPVMGFYAVSSVNFLPTFRDNLILTLEDETGNFSRKVVKELSPLAAQ